ncbi:MAG: T9SS type A sorting domain-containing protein, partial [Bacteroidales bacterium]|nr:T9SS type A sorting domain-containing protein [Bacteroidales bacterium]
TISVQDKVICPDGSTTLSVSREGGTGNLSYAWSNSLGSGVTSGSITTGGTYTVSVTATNVVGGVSCSSSLSTAQGSVTVNTPSVGTLSFTGNQEVCPGTPVTLEIASTLGSVGTLSFDWSAGTPTSGATSSTINVTASGEYRVDVMAERTLNGKSCQASDYRTAIISYKTPSSSDITAMGGIANGNILWTGHSTDWNGENNWMQYSTDGGGTYTLTDNPASSSNVVVGSYSTCVPSTTLNLNISPSVASIKVGSGITVSGNNAVTLSGDLVNGGTFDAPVVFNGTTELSGNGSTTLRDITINSGKTFNAGDKSLAISGNWTNNGTFSSTGTVTFAGGDVQTITGNAATTFNNVTFDNANGISISKEPTIDGTATFSRGVVTGDVTFGSSAKVSGASTSSHVDGIVKKNGAAKSTDFYFPTGSNGNLGKVVVTDGTATNVSVRYFSNPAGFSVNDLPRWWASASVSGFDHVSNVEYWKISSTDTITANFIAEASTDMHFNSGTAEEDKIPTNIQMAFYDNNRWTNVGGSASIGNNMLSITGAVIPASTTRGISGNYTTFGSKTASTVLPIELVSFTATCDGRSSLIEWTTATEKNNDYFSLERSDDAVNFTEIARVAGAGNSIEPIDYAYPDYGIHGGDNYYRLVQVDYDGTRTASEVIVANCIEPNVGEPDVQAYPNPFSGELTLVLDNFNNRAATIEVYDMLGKLIYTEKASAPQNSYETILNLSNLPSGAYTVRVSTTDFVINKNVVKQ